MGILADYRVFVADKQQEILELVASNRTKFQSQVDIFKAACDEWLRQAEINLKNAANDGNKDAKIFLLKNTEKVQIENNLGLYNITVYGNSHKWSKEREDEIVSLRTQERGSPEVHRIKKIFNKDGINYYNTPYKIDDNTTLSVNIARFGDAKEKELTNIDVFFKCLDIQSCLPKPNPFYNIGLFSYGAGVLRRRREGDEQTFISANYTLLAVLYNKYCNPPLPLKLPDYIKSHCFTGWFDLGGIEDATLQDVETSDNDNQDMPLLVRFQQEIKQTLFVVRSDLADMSGRNTLKTTLTEMDKKDQGRPPIPPEYKKEALRLYKEYSINRKFWPEIQSKINTKFKTEYSVKAIKDWQKYRK